MTILDLHRKRERLYYKSKVFRLDFKCPFLQNETRSLKRLFGTCQLDNQEYPITMSCPDQMVIGVVFDDLISWPPLH